MRRVGLSIISASALLGIGLCVLSASCSDNSAGDTKTDMGDEDSREAPTVTAVSPTRAVNNVTTPITITGKGFREGASVTVGGAACTSVSVVSDTSITCTAPSKAGSCGFQDIVVTNPNDKKGGTGSKLFAYASSGLAWATPVDYQVGNYPRRVITADINGDGELDLVSANQTGSTVTVRYGAGDGTFPMDKSVTVAIGAATVPMDVIAVDLNADGKLDLATVNAGGNGSVSALINQSESNFKATVTSTNVSSFSSGVALASGDYNGDGKVDLVVSSNASLYVLPLAGDGTGSFTPGTIRAVGGITSDIALIDMDGDGKLDLVTANFSTNSVTVALGAGNGTFSNPLNQNASTRPGGLFVTDLDGDKKLDVVVANTIGNNVSVLLGTGGGLLANPVQLPLGTNSPESVWVADWDGDGKPDIVTANSQSNNWSYFQGTSPTQYAAPVHTMTGTTPSGVASADLNGDGMQDLVLANAGSNNLQVILSACK